MPTMDTDPIPTEPTIDPEPPEPTSLDSGPSLVSGSPAAGRGRGTGIRRVAIGLVLVVTFGVGIGVGRLALPASGSDATATPAPSGQTNFGLIKEAWDTLHTKYVGAADLNDRDLIYGAINGMTEAVGDTGHTSFMTPDERTARNNDLSGKYVGIGVRIDTAEDGLPLIVGVFKDSPAEKAGLVAGDEIVAVDGKQTAGKDTGEIVDWVRGEAGTKVTVTARTGAKGPTRDVTMTRADVAVAPVSWTIVPGTKTALIRLDQFSAGAADNLKAVLGDAEKGGANRVILDLRGNPGGYVNEAIKIASQFLSDGIVYIDRDANGNETPQKVTPGGVALDLPLIVLVDQNSASSSEIVSGALQDAGRARIVGVTTFGTGTVLGEFELSDESALRIGTVEWLTPKGRQIWHNGITPDVIVERPSDVQPLFPDAVRDLTETEVESMDDPQLSKAIELSQLRVGETP